MKKIITDKCKIWNVDDKGKYAEVKFSTSRKLKDKDTYDQTQAEHGVANNGYISEYRSFVRFVGHAYNKVKELQSGDVITNLQVDEGQEPFYGDTNSDVNAAIDLLEKKGVVSKDSIKRPGKVYGVVYPRNLKTTVFDFDMYTPDNTGTQSRNLDKAPQVADDYENNYEDDVNTPVAKSADTAENNASASDECPF